VQQPTRRQQRGSVAPTRQPLCNCHSPGTGTAAQQPSKKFPKTQPLAKAASGKTTNTGTQQRKRSQTQVSTTRHQEECAVGGDLCGTLRTVHQRKSNFKTLAKKSEATRSETRYRGSRTLPTVGTTHFDGVCVCFFGHAAASTPSCTRAVVVHETFMLCRHLCVRFSEGRYRALPVLHPRNSVGAHPPHLTPITLPHKRAAVCEGGCSWSWVDPARILPLFLERLGLLFSFALSPFDVQGCCDSKPAAAAAASSLQV
jgi:hypothetical protein